MRSVAFTLGFILVAGGACASHSMDHSDSMAAAPRSEQPATSPLTDANIAAIVVAANTIDIKNGELALERSGRSDIRAFAQTMITDHSGVNKAAVDLVTKLEVAPVENATSTGLVASANETRAALAAKTGLDFDRAYIANEVDYHRAVLSAIDDALIPSAQNEELRALLVAVRPAVAAHLQHAESLKQQVGN
jgi:putative membrane protein